MKPWGSWLEAVCNSRSPNSGPLGAQVGDVKKVKRPRWGRGELESTPADKKQAAAMQVADSQVEMWAKCAIFLLSFFFLKEIHEFMHVCEISQFLNVD